MKHGCAAVVIAALCSTSRDAAAQSNPLMPVYQVVQSGATDAQAMILADALNIPPGVVSHTNGMVDFVAPANYLRVPTSPVNDPTITSNLLAGTHNLYPDIPIHFDAIDFNALANLTVINDNVALGSTSNAMNSAGLTPQFGTPIAGHTRFTAFYTNDASVVVSNSTYLDTEVSYHFSLPGGIPLLGPGAQVQVQYAPGGNVSRLHYAARQLVQGPMVPVISPTEASNRVAALFPPNTQIDSQLVYWSPPLLPWQTAPDTWNPDTIIPWYACSGTLNMADPTPGVVHPVRLKTRLIPATDEPAFVPSLTLVASGGTQVVATVRVAGGRPPYTYLWAGSDPIVSSNTVESIRYTPIRRMVPPVMDISHSSDSTLKISWPNRAAGFVLQSAPSLDAVAWSDWRGPVQTNDDVNTVSIDPSAQNSFFRLSLANQTVAAVDQVGVTVTDGNGVSVSGSTQVPVQVWPKRFNNPPSAPKISYGTESPNEPAFDVDRIGWQKAMGALGAGGGTESFCWLGGDAWPGDFIEPPTPGKYPANAHIYGNADLTGINTASIVLNNTDGAPDYFCASVPGAVSSDYNTAGLARPGNGWTVQAYVINGGNTINSHYYNVNYKYSWGPYGPNDFLNWLAMDCCDALDENGPGGTAPQRWGPAFGGLHILTGFNSGEAVADGSFEYNFAHLMLGSQYLPPLPIVGSWFLAAAFAGYDGHGFPAAMGPIGPSAISDYTDYYWGKGAVNPTIPPAQIKGWWYETAP